MGPFSFNLPQEEKSILEKTTIAKLSQGEKNTEGKRAQEKSQELEIHLFAHSGMS